MDVVSAASWNRWEKRGCKDLKQLFAEMFHRDMPPTCMSSTHPDNAILCPIMQRFLVNIEVMPGDEFATHNPVIISLQTQEPQPMRSRLPMPKTYLDFQVTQQELDDALRDVPFDASYDLQGWGNRVETLVSQVLTQRKHSDKGDSAPAELPRAYRGRCQPRQPVLVPFPAAAKPSRHGEYQPGDEIVLQGSKRRLKQYRTLYHQLVAHGKDSCEKWYRSVIHLRTEWKTVLGSRSFGRPFHVWLQQHPDIGPAMWPLPSAEWLFHVMQLVRFELDAHIAADRALLRKMNQLQTLEDQKCGSKKNFAYVKASAKSPLQELVLPTEVICDAAWSEDGSQVSLQLDPEALHWGTPVFVAERKGWVISNHADKDNLVARLTERHHLFDLPNISRADTIAILNRFSSPDRGQLVREIAGAFQTQVQKQKWNGSDTLQCPFCHMNDSRQHRICECPAFSREREPFHDSVAWLQNHAVYRADLPVVLEHDLEEPHRLLQFMQHGPIIAPAFFDHARSRKDADLPLHMYTDGSCSDPTHATTRIAAYAVAMDLCNSDEQRESYVRQFLKDHVMPDCFQLVCQTRVTGEQNIGRAEFAALEVTTRFPGRVVVHSDSSISLRHVQRIRDMTFDFHSGNNLDIAHAVSCQLHPAQTFRKVKAHREVTADMHWEEIFHILGNRFVDEAAKQPCLPSWDDFSASLCQRHSDVQQIRDHIEQLYHLILRLQRARIQMETATVATHDDEQLQIVGRQRSNLEVISEFFPATLEPQTWCDWGRPLFRVFPWGEAYADSFQRWFTTLCWSKQDHVPACCNTGVTWLELAISYAMFLESCLPVIRDDCQGCKMLVLTASLEDCARFNIALSDLANAMQLMWSHFMWMVHPTRQPVTTRGLCKALIWLGYQQHSSGLLQRPVFYKQKEVVRYPWKLRKSSSGRREGISPMSQGGNSGKRWKRPNPERATLLCSFSSDACFTKTGAAHATAGAAPEELKSAGGLKVPGAEGMPNPYVEVECIEEKRTTQVISGASACTFNNFYNFSKRMSKDEFEGGDAVVVVYHQKTLLGKNLAGFKEKLGQVTFSLEKVYNQEGHLVPKDWFVIVLPDDPGHSRPAVDMQW
eukprot:Skav233784  [mRNA]  locus=scaffold780:250908:258735:- [translate_table: standard]